MGIVTNEVKKIFQTKFDYNSTDQVPNVETNSDLTYSNGDEQKGLELTSCVLFVDIRDSIKMNSTHYTHTRGRMYTSFVASCLRAAKEHKGCVRNIIGDRVMIAFPATDCFKNAVLCAISINHIAKKIITNYLPDFRVGIGIDYGTMRVYKVGIITNGPENAENKNLVWIGEPANFASRLTDMANKDLPTLFKLKRFLFQRIGRNITTAHNYTAEELSKRLSEYNESEFDRILSVKPVPGGRLAPILITEPVLKGYSQACPECRSVKEGWWKQVDTNIKDVSKNVYQADIWWA